MCNRHLVYEGVGSSTFFRSPGKAEDENKLCEQCKTTWTDNKKESDKFKREYSRFRDGAEERDPKTRRNGA